MKSEGFSPDWEPLLWGGTVINRQPHRTSPEAPPAATSPSLLDELLSGTKTERGESSPDADRAQKPQDTADLSRVATGVWRMAPSAESGLLVSEISFPRIFTRMPYRNLRPKRIPPLYSSPRLPGEGVWQSEGMPTDETGWPIIFNTSYRPSSDYPNAIVHMLLFDMSRIAMRLYIGSAEPEAPENASQIESEKTPYLLAITNALWKQKHSRDAGAIYRGRLLRDMQPGMATLVTYVDDSVDIVEWNDGIPLSIVLDARQLRHLIVKDGRVVNSVVRAGRESDSEIGLGFLLVEEEAFGLYHSGGYFSSKPVINYSEDWFIASRSAFGIRPDGNLVFALGHHISTKDLAKALVLAGCDRAIHGDANPHNVLANLYYTDREGNIVKRAKLSPEQKDYTLHRYIDKSYTSDFYAFFQKASCRTPASTVLQAASKPRAGSPGVDNTEDP